MSDINIQVPLISAERMFAKLGSLDEEHENYEFIVTEVGIELDKADKALRVSVMDITSEMKDSYTNRITTMRTGLAQHRLRLKQIKEAKRFSRRFY